MGAHTQRLDRPDYGVDAPNVLRNLLLFGVLCVLMGLIGPRELRLGSASVLLRGIFLGTGLVLIVEGLLFLLYVKFGKVRHRDLMLSLHRWRGDEQVLDVGCGRGLLIAGAAKILASLHGSGRATGIDIWSHRDMAGNSESATRKNLELEGVADRCTLLGLPAQEMPFADGTFDVVLSNLCLHNIEDRTLRQRAVRQVARVLKPGGIVILSDFKLTGEYGTQLQRVGLHVERKWGNLFYTFPPLRIVIGHKPPA